MTAAERALQAEHRRALDERIFNLGYRVPLGYYGHHRGCRVGLDLYADCTCEQIARGIRVSRARMVR
jgi:hypothetical protein